MDWPSFRVVISGLLYLGPLASFHQWSNLRDAYTLPVPPNISPTLIPLTPFSHAWEKGEML